MIDKEKIIKDLELKRINGAGNNENIDGSQPYAMVAKVGTHYGVVIYPSGDSAKIKNFWVDANTLEEAKQILKDNNIPDDQVIWWN